MSPAAYRRLIAVLEALYGDVLMRRDDVAYPVTFFPADDEQTIDDVLLSPTPTTKLLAADCYVYAADHLEARRQSRRITNGLCYVVLGMQADPPRLAGALGRYFDMMATCDALDHELRDYVHSADGAADSAGAELYGKLPLRERFHRYVAPRQALYDARGRCAVIGVATLTAFYHDGDYHLILVQRSAELGTGAGLFHVMPAFVMQPVSQSHEADWSLRGQILREYGEELFAMPEPDDADATPPPDYHDAHPPVAELNTMLADGRAELHVTGVALNLLSLRYEVTTLLVIHDPDWHTRHQSALTAALSTERQATHYVPLSTLAGLPDDLHLRAAPHGAVALWQGIDRLQVMAGYQ